MQSLLKLIWNQIEIEKIKNITAYLNKLRYLSTQTEIWYILIIFLLFFNWTKKKQKKEQHLIPVTTRGRIGWYGSI